MKMLNMVAGTMPSLKKTSKNGFTLKQNNELQQNIITIIFISIYEQ